jgi:hypothetical protein
MKNIKDDFKPQEFITFFYNIKDEMLIEMAINYPNDLLLLCNTISLDIAMHDTLGRLKN